AHVIRSGAQQRGINVDRAADPLRAGHGRNTRRRRKLTNVATVDRDMKSRVVKVAALLIRRKMIFPFASTFTMFASCQTNLDCATTGNPRSSRRAADAKVAFTNGSMNRT
ncbi:MAG: hypothetical protein ACXVIJ_12750, partial [Thermoanaerobaculia bacterium]